MGLIYENECCSCASGSYACRGSLCPLREVPHLYCDECDEETTLYYFDNEMLCLDCIVERLDKVDIREVAENNDYY